MALCYWVEYANSDRIKILVSYIFRDGIEFITPENKPSEYSLTYAYPYKVEQEYLQAESKWNNIVDGLIAETSLTVPPHRYDYTRVTPELRIFLGFPPNPGVQTNFYG